jgi:hypothetical protein
MVIGFGEAWATKMLEDDAVDDRLLTAEEVAALLRAARTSHVLVAIGSRAGTLGPPPLPAPPPIDASSDLTGWSPIAADRSRFRPPPRRLSDRIADAGPDR